MVDMVLHPNTKTQGIPFSAERSFFGVVKTAIGERYEIFAKIRVADVLEPRSGGGRQGWQRAFNCIAMKHFDFVLCDPDTCQTIAAIELDDSSHRAAKAKERDAFLNEACHSAGFPLIRFPARRAYSHHDVATTISNAISSDPTPRNPEQNVTDSTPKASPEQASVPYRAAPFQTVRSVGNECFAAWRKRGSTKERIFGAASITPDVEVCSEQAKSNNLQILPKRIHDWIQFLARVRKEFVGSDRRERNPRLS